MLAPVNRLWKGIQWRLAKAYQKASYGLYSHGLYQFALLYRRTLRRTVFIGITGSAGKSTTKDLVACILERHLPGIQKVSGTENKWEYLARLVLQTRGSDAYCVTEVGILTPGSIDRSLAIVRPTVGVVTNIGSDHFSEFRSLDAIAEEKSKLIKALPDDGIAILNSDDPRVIAMQSLFPGRTITYGIGDNAMLRGEAISSSWPNRLSFTVAWKGQSVRVQTRLCGSHWVPVVLGALATGVALEVPLKVAAEAVASVEPFEGRMSPVQVGDGVTFIRDDWKAPFWTIAPTFDFMRQARAARKIIVIGTISDYSGDSTKRYVETARQALAIADCVLFVGPRASASLRAKRDSRDQLLAFPSLKNASNYLSGYLRSGDLVLLKGSTRADHLERLIIDRTSGTRCWLSACHRVYFCDECNRVDVVSDPDATEGAVGTILAEPEPSAIAVGLSTDDQPPVVVVGLGNPGEQYANTPHNVGRCVVDILAQRFGERWTQEGELAMVVRTTWEGRPIRLLKLLTPMNHAGPALLRLVQTFGCTIEDCILVHDDLELPNGTVRTRMRGGAGGHLGVQSIIQAFQNDRICRVKVGVGRPPSGTSVLDYVLTPFPSELLAAVESANRAATERLIELIRQTPSSVTSQARKAPV